VVTLVLAMLACTVEPTPTQTPTTSTGGDTDPTGDSGDSGDTDDTGAVEVWMGPEAMLARLSLDLLGERPSPEDLAAVTDDERYLEDFVAAALDDERFGARLRDWYAELYLTRSEFYPVLVQGYGVGTPHDFWASVGDETLRLLSEVALQDLPWTTVLTADWTMADPNLGQFWPLDYPEDGTGWQQAHYTDDRPAAGVLSTNSFYWRYTSTGSNANRGRANAVTRLFLCHDYLDSSIEFDADLDLLDEDAIREALQYNPACVNCHVSLDPISAHFYGFFLLNTQSAIEGTYYHAARELWWQDYSYVGPSYYGSPSETLEDLAINLANDPRFVTCAVEQVTEALLREAAVVEDLDLSTAHREAFIASDLRMDALVHSVLGDPRYRGTEHDRAVPAKFVTTELLASQVEGLTGFAWAIEGNPALKSDADGVRILGGGLDGYAVRTSARSPTPTFPLVSSRLAEAAATHAVQRDLALDLDERTLFAVATLDGSDDEATVQAQLSDLHLRVLSRSPDEAELSDLVALHDTLVETEADAGLAWAAVLSALLRDPEFLSY